MSPPARPPNRQISHHIVEGTRLRVATTSPAGATGPPLLLFNGIGANLELCFPFMEALPEREIVIFDVPGVGRSEMSWRPRRFPGLARLANKLLDRLGYQHERPHSSLGYRTPAEFVAEQASRLGQSVASHACGVSALDLTRWEEEMDLTLEPALS